MAKNLASKVSLLSQAKKEQAFTTFWNSFKKEIAKNSAQQKELDLQLAKFQTESKKIDEELSRFQHFLKSIPIASTIANWIFESSLTQNVLERYLKAFSQLTTKNILQLHDAKGNLLTLAYFMEHGHQDLIEKIRTIDDWSIFEKEELVKCYIEFTHSLARNTYDLIPLAFDSDRDRVQQKIVTYDSFIDFVQQLPKRDALIAKLLYFGAPSLEEIMALTISAVNKKRPEITFNEVTITLPQHIYNELSEVIKGKTSSQLVFCNVRGEKVNRTHLNQSFIRASEKSSLKVKITPASLLKLDSRK
ncbi:MAG: site-specific integrase [Chlamydiales bacterium]|nr:site-specific integrase [Chlamydiales bacterium]